MILGKPAPFVSACIDAVDDAIRQQHPNHGLSAMQRTWLAFCVTAVLVTNSICWARFQRASLGTYAMAALSWMFRQSKMPWDHLLVASMRVILRHHPDMRVHCITADALYGTASFVDEASALFGGVQVISQIRSNQNIRIGKHAQHVADYFATHPGTRQTTKILTRKQEKTLTQTAHAL